MLKRPSLEIQTTDNYLDWTSLTVVNMEGITFSSRSIPVGVDSEIDVASLQFSTPIYLTPPAKVKRLGVTTSIISNIFNEQNGDINLGATIAGQIDGTEPTFVTRVNTKPITGNGEDDGSTRTVDDGEFPNTGTAGYTGVEAYTVTGNFTFLRVKMDRSHLGDGTTYSTDYGSIGYVRMSA